MAGNIDKIMVVAEALGDLRSHVVFVALPYNSEAKQIDKILEIMKQIIFYN
jgi:hypothetical protein